MENSSPVAGPYSRLKTPGDHPLYSISIYYDNTPAVALLLAGLCVGLLGLVGAILWLLRSKNTKALTVLNVSLVFVALLQCVSSPAWAKLMLDGMCWVEHCNKLLALWFASRHCGAMLHQLATLEFYFVEAVSAPGLRRVNYSLTIVLTSVVVCLLFADVSLATNVGLGAVVCLFAMPVMVSWTVLQFKCFKCKGPGPWRKAIALALAVTSFAIYAPAFVMSCIMYSGTPVDGYTYDVVVFLNNLRLVTDAGLFWLITRESNAPLSQLQQDTDTAAGVGSVPMVGGVVGPQDGQLQAAKL